MLDIQKIKNTIEKYKLIEEGDRIVIAISGGPDSVCLMHLLHEIKDTYSLTLFGAHLNHNFRGIEAQKDAQYVIDLCESLSIMPFVKSINVPTFAKEKGYSLEEAGRIMRYIFFDEVAEKVGANKIAVAHNLNDQAETLLMRLLRGTGLQGLTAIHHKRGRVIRPLLDVNRDDIEAYCHQHQLNPRIDHTNQETIYHRNKIRLELIPKLMEYNPNILEVLANTTEILKLDNEYINKEAENRFSFLANIKEHRVTLSITDIIKEPLALQGRIFRLAAEALVGKKEIMEYKHIQLLLEFIGKDTTGKKLQLPMGITAIKCYQQLIFTTEDMNEGEDITFIHQLPLNSMVKIPEINGSIKCQVIKKHQLQEIPQQKYIKAFDYDKIKDKLYIRNRKEGDRFWPSGLKGTKKLKDFFIDYKIEREKRNLIPLICDGEEIMWVLGYRISEIYKINKSTDNILLIEFQYH